ncbi:hypothetical protein HGRIS_010107 [Hohenbuehelia grisea]|uniref:Cytochrome c oxidase assembly factor 3 n=1 Tax=Hohenbuehelia grisea TaxID=104357 RepID=A0ABR3J3N6_9AGAR
MQDTKYADRKTVNASYRPKSNLMSPGLKRARAPFRLSNAITGLTLGAFAVGVWAYSISAVKQDVFDDIDEEARALQSGTSAAVASLEDAKTTAGAFKEPVTSHAPGVTPDPSSLVQPPHGLPPVRSGDSIQQRGLLAKFIGDREPRLLDPARHTLVWGAPPVDNMGKMQLRSSK